MKDSCSTKPNRIRNKLLINAAVALFLLFILLPIYWMILTSLKTNAETMVLPPKILFVPTLDNYVKSFTNSSFLKAMLNSVIISSAVTILTLFCGATSSYAFTRFRMFGNKTISSVILITRMFPGIVLGLPLFIIANRFDLLDTYFIMIIAIATFALPFQIWMLMGFFAQTPKSLDESARIDGCSWYSAFARIIIPTVAPGLAATAIMTFFFSWNDFFFALILARNTTKTAPLAILEYVSLRTFDWAAIMSSGVLLMIPTLTIGFVFQKYMIKGLNAGAVKG